MKRSNNHLTRRKLLKDSARAGLVGGLTPLIGSADSSSRKRGIIELENMKAGTTDWQLTYIKTEHHRSKSIEGYCSKTSLRPGESIDIFLSAEDATNVSVDIYRIGYYGGKGGRFMRRLGPFAVTPQPTPPIAEHRLRACNWERSTSFTVPDDWVSGVYLGKISCTTHRFESYIIFVLRDDRKADVLFQTSDTTWQAYNKWPDEYSL
ncbi:MAG TPA: N,N-dimethylformamidase beta subunit family domain-containing protein, partial [Flavitalea sp.]|nr:N,N-dimethylformamidase beta subunit family domain-containing protein [Flavitalea sp.]